MTSPAASGDPAPGDPAPGDPASPGPGLADGGLTSDPELAEALRAGGVRLDAAPGRPHIAVVTLDRPDVRNAQTPATWHALRLIGERLTAFDESDVEHGTGPDPGVAPVSGVRAVLVRGTGRSFSAGLDRRLFSAQGHDGQPGLVELGTIDPAEADERIAGYQSGFVWLRDPRLLTVAAVSGHALGAGFQLALACDLRVVAPDAALGMLETSLGLVPDLGGTLPLVQSVGYARAVELCLSGRHVGADEALALGLAQERAASPETVDETAYALMDRLLTAPEGAVRETLALLDAAADGPDPFDHLADERAAQVRRLRTMLHPG